MKPSFYPPEGWIERFKAEFISRETVGFTEVFQDSAIQIDRISFSMKRLSFIGRAGISCRLTTPPERLEEFKVEFK
jgi:hypothetical protein